MGKLTEAFKKLDAGKTSFVNDVEKWQTETKNYLAAARLYQQKLSELAKVDNEILDQIKDSAAKTKKSAELADARGHKLDSLWPKRAPADTAQKKAFDNCEAFEKLIAESEGILKGYDTKGKATKEQKKVDAKKLLLQAKLDLAEVKKQKINYEYQGDGSAQHTDVMKASAEIDRLKKKIAGMTAKLKEDVTAVDDGK
jgi:hypothetical protein